MRIENNKISTEDRKVSKDMIKYRGQKSDEKKEIHRSESDEELFRLKKVDKDELREKIEEINEVTDIFNLNRSIDMKTRDGQVVVSVVDGEGKVIRQVPPEKVLSFRKKFREILGLFIDRQM